MEKEPIEVFKLTLSSGKVVLVRDIEMKDEEIASTIAGKKAGDNQLAMMMSFQTEMTKLIVMKVDDKDLTAQERQMLGKNILDRRDFVQVRGWVAKNLMGEMTAEPQVEFVTSGQQ